MTLTRRKFVRSSAALIAAQTIGRAAPNDRIHVGFIGTGARGQELIQAVQKNPRTEIVGLCDAYTGRIERSLDRTNHRPKVYKTHREMLAEKALDAVVVATPDHLHRQIVLDALHAGKDVYCENPLTYRSDEGHGIVKAARDGGRIVQVGSQGISSALQQKARQIIRSGWLGTTTTVRATCNRNTVSGAWIYPIPPDASPKTVNWDMFLGSAPHRPFSLERFFRWQCFEDYSGGIASDLFVDLCTTIHYLLDVSAPARVVAMGESYRWGLSRDVPDTLNAILEYPRSFVVNLSANFSNENPAGTTIEFLGTEGTLKLDSAGMSFEPEEPVEDNRRVVETWPEAMEDAYYKRSIVAKTEIEPAKARMKEQEKEEERGQEQKGQENEDPKEANDPERPHRYKTVGPDATVTHFGHFFDSIQSRQPYWEDATAGHRAAACAHMINRSVKEKRIVEWDFDNDEIRN